MTVTDNDMNLCINFLVNLYTQAHKNATEEELINATIAYNKAIKNLEYMNQSREVIKG